MTADAAGQARGLGGAHEASPGEGPATGRLAGILSRVVGLDRYAGRRLTVRPVLTSEQCDVCHPMGVIGFDVGRHSRRSGSRTQGYLVNDPCKLTGADSNRTDFALAA
jgi:hypothetical protein